MPLVLRHLLLAAARRAAADPRVRAKAKEIYEDKARPVLARKARELKEEAARRDPEEHPARFVGRAFKRFLDG